MRILLCVMALLLAAPAAPVAAQRGDPPDAVPLEFVQRLAIGPLGGPEGILVGRLSPRVLDVVPDEAVRIVGSLEYPEFSTGALVIGGRPDAVRERLDRHLVSRGWSVRDPQADEARGFLASPEVPTVRDAVSYCDGAGARLAMLLLRPHAGDSTAVDVVHLAGENAMCAPAAGQARRPHHPSMLPLPDLRPPADARVDMASTHGTDTESSASAHMTTSRPIAEIVAHYAAEMNAAGWTAGESVVGAAGALQSFRRTGADGVAMRAALAIQPRAGGRYQLRLDVWREEP